MIISDIQKVRFLNTIYKIYYSLGSAPSDNEVSSLYGRYFSRYPVGQTIPVNYNDLSTNLVIDQDKLNRIMVHMLYNLDSVYEAYHEHVQDLYDIVTSFSKRLESISSKRAEIEKKVDDQLFALRNTDGFYYSSTNAFNDTSLVDLNFTTAFIDTKIRKATIPTITSGLFDYVANILNTSRSSSLQVIFEGNEVVSETTDFANVFNGLTNSVWSYNYQSRQIGLCTLRVSIPITASNERISLIEGKIKSEKPLDIGIIVVDPKDRSKSAIYTKNSAFDYDRFSFSLTPQTANAVEIYLTKEEPDYVTTSADSVIYNYDFKIDELIITSPYYDANATLVSRPISLPVKNNSKLSIDAISISAEEQIPQGCDIRYYIAADNPVAANVYDFNWFSISPLDARNPTNPSVVNFNSTQFIQSTIEDIGEDEYDPTSQLYSMYKIPREDSFKNPIPNYFYQSDKNIIGFNLYRMAKFPQGIKPYDSYILENVDSNQLSVYISSGSSLDKQTWQEVLTGQRNDIVPTILTKTVDSSSVFFSAGQGSGGGIPYGSIYLSTSIYAENDINITDLFLKSLAAQYWDIRIYLNGIDLTSSGQLSAGVLSANITWNIKKGKNDLVIIINKSESNNTQTPFNGSISLIKDRSILSIPGLKLFKNYLYEVKIEDLRYNYSNIDNVYSIINYENNYEIVYRRTEEIKTGSKVYYYYNSEQGVQAIRLRADLFRGNSFDAAPSVISYTIKFKH